MPHHYKTPPSILHPTVQRLWKLKVTRRVRVHFTLGSYHDYVDYDVVPMQACSLLLGRPWQYDNSVTHHGRTNSYTLVFDGKTINLLPMTPDEIIHSAKAKSTYHTMHSMLSEIFFVECPNF